VSDDRRRFGLMIGRYELTSGFKFWRAANLIVGYDPDCDLVYQPVYVPVRAITSWRGRRPLRKGRPTNVAGRAIENNEYRFVRARAAGWLDYIAAANAAEEASEAEVRRRTDADSYNYSATEDRYYTLKNVAIWEDKRWLADRKSVINKGISTPWDLWDRFKGFSKKSPFVIEDK